MVGVGGFLMYGGGYSFHTSEHGLGVDQVVEYTLVLPCGDVKKVSARSDRELFNALKGTGNNVSRSFTSCALAGTMYRENINGLTFPLLFRLSLSHSSA